MPWNGVAPNKTFGRTDGTRTGAQTWQEADGAGVDIISSDHDTHDQDVADGLNSALMKDGGNTATSNLPMGGFRHTNVGDATARTNYVSFAQMMDKGALYIPTVGGSANAITLTTGFSMSAYVTGQKFRFKVGTTNTGATTINIDSIGVKSVMRTSTGVAVTSGDLVADAMVEVAYDGTNFQLTTPSTTATSADVYARILGVGTVFLTLDATPRAGFVRLTETTQSLLKASYPELNAWASAQSYPWGSDSTTFNIPPAAGYFPRFAATSSDIDTSGVRTPGSTQSDQNKTHTHGAGTLAADSAGDHQHFSFKNVLSVAALSAVNYPSVQGPSSGGSYTVAGSASAADVGLTSSNGAHPHAISGSTASSGSDEARVKNVAFHADMLAIPAAAAAGVLGVHGLQYTWNTGTSGDPGAGRLLVDHATLASVTALNICETDASGASVAAYLATWDDSTSTTKGYIHVEKVGAPGTYAIFAVSGTLTDNGGYDTFAVAHVSSAGTLANGDNVSVLFYRNGDKGDTGATGDTGSTGASGVDAGLRFNFDSSTSMADPGAGDIRLNHASFASVTAIAVDDTSADSGNPDVSAFVLAWDDSTNTALRGSLSIKKIANPENFAIYSITGASTDNSGWTQLAVTHVSSNGSFTNADALSIAFTRTGDKGTDGLGAGDVTAASGFGTDNVLVRSDGTGKGVQATGIAVDDSNHVSGPASLTLPNTGLHLLDTNASHDLILAPGSDLSADRTLTITTGDADRTLTLSGNPTLGDWFDQSVKAAATPQFAALEIGHATQNTLTGSGGNLRVEGNLLYRAGGTDVPIADGGTGASDAATAFSNLKQAATTSATGVMEQAVAAEYRAKTSGNLALTPTEVWDAAAEVTLTDAATVAVDFSTFINAVLTLAGNRAMGNPTNEKVGQSGYIRIVQDGTGTRTLSYGTDWEFAGGSAPVLSTAAGTQDLLFYQILAADRIFGTLVKAIA